jgi:plasmid replication initiation protein
VVKLIFFPSHYKIKNKITKHFTKYSANPFYELLIAWRSTGKTPIFELADFREKLGVDKTDYAIISDLKKRVLDISVKQLNETLTSLLNTNNIKKDVQFTAFHFYLKTSKQSRI